MANAKKTTRAIAPPMLRSWCKRRLQARRMRCRIDTVERSQRADDDLARNDGAEQADADLPVEAERTNHRLDEVADVADDARRKRSEKLPP